MSAIGTNHPTCTEQRTEQFGCIADDVTAPFLKALICVTAADTGHRRQSCRARHPQPSRRTKARRQLRSPLRDPMQRPCKHLRTRRVEFLPTPFFRQRCPILDDVSLVKPLTCTEQFGKRGHVPPLAKRCSTFAFGSYPWPLA